MTGIYQAAALVGSEALTVMTLLFHSLFITSSVHGSFHGVRLWNLAALTVMTLHGSMGRKTDCGTESASDEEEEGYLSDRVIDAVCHSLTNEHSSSKVSGSEEGEEWEGVGKLLESASSMKSPLGCIMQGET